MSSLSVALLLCAVLAVTCHAAFAAVTGSFTNTVTYSDGLADVVDLHCSIDRTQGVEMDVMYISDMDQKRMVAKMKSVPVKRWGGKDNVVVTVTGCNDCDNPAEDNCDECQSGEKAFLRVVMSNYGELATASARKFICIFTPVDKSVGSFRELMAVSLRENLQADISTSGLYLSIETRYRYTGQVRHYDFRCSLESTWARVDTIGIAIGEGPVIPRIIQTRDDVAIRDISKAEILDVVGSINCTATNEATDPNHCLDAENAFIDVSWKNYNPVKFGPEFTNVNCTVTGDKAGNGEITSENALIVYRTNEPTPSPVRDLAKYSDAIVPGKANMLVYPTLNTAGELTSLLATCSVFDLSNVTRIEIFNTNTSVSYVAYDGSSPATTTSATAKPSGTFNPVIFNNGIAYARIYWETVDLSSADFASNTGDFIFLTCRVTYDGTTQSTADIFKATRIRGGRRYDSS